jgi:hypothetical protein
LRRAVILLVVFCLGGLAEAEAPSGGTPGEVPVVELPFTVEKVWYRAGGKRREGDLTISEEGIELVARKRAFSVPLDRIQFISYGTRKWDVDTDWAVLSVGVTRPWDLVGIRDGKKWGYGSRTREIYTRLRRALRQLGAAQYRVEPGFQAYEDPDHGCSLSIPESWSTYVESLVVAGGGYPRGTTIFSERPIRAVESGAGGRARAVDDLELLDAILAGESPGFFLERAAAQRGMTCGGFSSGSRRRVLAYARRDLIFGEDDELIETPTLSEATVAGCAALFVTGRSRRPDGAEVVLEIYAAANGDTLYYFGLRTLADRHAAHREPFAAALETVKFSVPSPR